MTTSAKGLGAYAAEQRKLKELSQAELAECVSVSHEWVSCFECGSGSQSLRSVMWLLRDLEVTLLR